jgi:hypothetical protein
MAAPSYRLLATYQTVEKIGVYRCHIKIPGSACAANEKVRTKSMLTI